MKYILVTLLTLTTSLLHGADKPPVVSSSKPNIVVILADDMCYNALSATGGTLVQTPNIDRIFENGRFMPQGYVTHAVCAPSRAGLITGRYQSRFGYETLTDNDTHAKKVKHGVNLNERTIADILKTEGYATAAMGKWHLGVNEEFQPNQRGFDHFYGFSGRCVYYNCSKKGLIRNGEATNEDPKAYLTDLMANEADTWIRSVKDQPFFLYFATFAVHAPFQAPEEYVTEGEHIMTGMIKGLDLAVERITNTLDELGLRDNTIIVFLNDNGGVRKLGDAGFDNGIYKEGKASYYEGGVRVPFAIQWPGKIGSGTFDHPTSSLDLVPTLAAAAGADLPTDRDYDGINLLPYLSGESKDYPERTLFWRAGWGHAVRKGDWKLVWPRNKPATKKAWKKSGAPKPPKTDLPNYEDRETNLYLEPELYNVAKDPSEEKDLSKQHPEIVQMLIQELDRYDGFSGK